MAKRGRSAARRDDGLSHDRIVEMAIDILDEEGEDALTLRELAIQLDTGPGALYWHVANKREVLVAATHALVMKKLSAAKVWEPGLSPLAAIRAIALAVYTAVDEHPWLGAQLTMTPWENATLQIFERIGRQVLAIEVPARYQLSSASALMSYILGVSVQNAAQSRAVTPDTDRTKLLADEAARWKNLDEQAFPFLRTVSGQLRKHNDETEFMQGLQLILRGINALGALDGGSKPPRRKVTWRTSKS